MRARLSIIALPLAATLSAGSACAMNSPTNTLIDCRVVGGDKLPAATGGSDALCAAIRQAAAEDAPGRKFSVEVRVLGASMVAATLTTADGTRLPEQKLRVSDHVLTKGSLDRFARTLAGEVARAASR